MANITANDNDNFLFGTSDNDQIFGLGGNDIISGGGGNDLIDGGLGNDSLSGDGGNDTFKGSSGDDTLNGGSGTDTADYSQLGQNVTLLSTGTIVKGGGFGSDQLIQVERFIADASAVNNAIDMSSAAAGVSINVNLLTKNLTVTAPLATGIFTVTNFDDVKGTNESDIITGDIQNNQLFGNDGNDILNGTRGNDILSGGNGIDTVDYSLLDQSITLLPTGLVVKGGGFGNDQLIQVEKIIADAGVANNTIDVSTAGVGASINVNLQTQQLIVNGVPGVGTFTVSNFDNVKGTNESDIITGDAQNNQLFGNDGHDTISGGAGNDLIDGGLGNDDLAGGDGNDTLKGSSGDDILNGGNGTDTVDYSQLGQSITLLPTGIIVKDAGFGNDQLIQVETIIADASAANNTIDVSGAGGNASINVNLQTQKLIVAGVSGVGTFTVTNFDNVLGTNKNDTITGDAQNNQLFGNDGNDTISGGAGNDLISGGLGNDILAGGAGADTFVFNSLSEGIDTIKDYTFSQGDIIQISKIGFGASSINDFSYNLSSGKLSFLNTEFAVIANKATSLSIVLT
ncbi:calcium-binding protein [Nostoc sp. FACHB-973]|nr:calcium-binding protein [Nostoc sp. FACHB-973]